jgi:APA family basic amino acid/polyamine antiporter
VGRRLLTIGAVVGTGIFLTAGDVARSLPHPALVLAVWLAGGLLVLAGALSYAEMGAMYPRAGGLYHFLREAWGPLPAFLYGWTCLMVIMTGGIAAIAVGFRRLPGALVPAFSSTRVAVRGAAARTGGAQLAALIAIAMLTATNHFGVRQGASVQNLFTLAKLGAIAALVVGGALRPAVATVDWHAALPGPLPSLAVPFGVALIATLWTYDGWYALTFSAGEVRDPRRDLPRGLILGVAIVIVAYALLNLIWPAGWAGELSRTSRVAEAAARAVRRCGARAMTAPSRCRRSAARGDDPLLVAHLQPMAADGVFRGVAGSTRAGARRSRRCGSRARGPPRSRSPAASSCSRTSFGGVLFGRRGLALLFRLRATRPGEPRPYRAWGWPVVPALFVLGMALLTLNTLQSAPRESLLGLLAIAAGLPAYAAWRRSSGSRAAEAVRRL